MNRSADEKIDLVPFEEFLKHAPESSTSKFKDFDPNDHEQAHCLRLARLEWELTQRKDLAEQCKVMDEEKMKVIAGMVKCLCGLYDFNRIRSRN